MIQMFTLDSSLSTVIEVCFLSFQMGRPLREVDETLTLSSCLPNMIAVCFLDPFPYAFVKSLHVIEEGLLYFLSK